jgi:hypothetical protein
MTCLRWTATVALVALTACVALAERERQEKKDANVVVVGDLVKITPTEKKIGDNEDGVDTKYDAELKVTAVQKGEGIKAGDTLKITWNRITKKPTGVYAGAVGHEYNVKKGDKVEAYLIKRDGGTYEVIYNPAGMEVKK